jgi:hypothetical protein
MQSFRRAAVVALALILPGISAAGASARTTTKLPADYAAWSHVAQCETSTSNPWQVLGTKYPDPFGITAHNWAWAGGKPIPIGPVPSAARTAAIKVADRFIQQTRDQHPRPGRLPRVLVISPDQR